MFLFFNLVKKKYEEVKDTNLSNFQFEMLRIRQPRLTNCISELRQARKAPTKVARWKI